MECLCCLRIIDPADGSEMCDRCALNGCDEEDEQC